MKSPKSQVQRFAAWCRLGGNALVTLGRQVEEQILPEFIAAGYRRVAVFMGDRADPVRASEIQLERVTNDEVDSITFLFHKFRKPAFQVQVGKRKCLPDGQWLRAANLVSRPREYFHYWGKPWWQPARWWSDRLSLHIIKRVQARTTEIHAYLECGQASLSLRPRQSIMEQSR